MGKRVHHLREVNEEEAKNNCGHLLVHAHNRIGWCSVRK